MKDGVGAGEGRRVDNERAVEDQTKEEAGALDSVGQECPGT